MPNFKVWQDSLRDHGWIEGKNLIVDYRSAEGHAARVAPLANELVALKPDVLVGPSAPEALALKSATASIPIVFAAVADPVRLGLVQSLSHPGGNITGLASIVPGNIVSKRIQILREIVPAASKIAILVNPSNADHGLFVAEELPETTRKLGVTFQVLEATTVEELDIAFTSAAAQHADAIIPLGSELTVNNVARVTALAAEHRLPAVYVFRLFAINGGLVSYGADITDLLRRAGDYVDKILKGTKPADLPVEQPTKFDLVINLKAAKALGLEIPASLLARADEVIE
ncbi:ABC transporter substrate-binding protein [Bradyrhizobium sp. 1200_D9_N1_1]|uniref:ABC transporter substrate-binding protein n=1 Tax=Bradyrhizobium sp. 1200_D9_N1_1 TaxID=3239013 RepID=UPI003F8C5114